MHRYRTSPCAFALLVFLLSLFEVLPVNSAEPWSFKNIETVQINVPKRTKDTKQFDEIRVNDIRPEEVKEVALTEAHLKSRSHQYSKPEGADKYRHYNTYGKDDYEKYHKKDKYDHSKYDKQHKKPKYDICKLEKKHRHRCTAFFIATTGNQDALMLKSVNGEPLTLASTYIPENVTAMSIFSNKARGSSCSGNDIEVVYTYDNDTQSAARYVYYGDSANLVYETILTEETLILPYAPIVTDVNILKGMFKVDAFNFPSIYSNVPVQDPFRQYNLNSKSGALISSDSSGFCCDVFFFSEKCVRWLCMGRNPEPTGYLRDPSTGTIYIPPADNDPARLIMDPVNLMGAHGTAGTLCGKSYMAGFTTTAVLGNTRFGFMRARVKITYPYFKDTEVFYQTEEPDIYPLSYIYAAPETDVAFACSGERFWRFDKVFTAAVPIIPTVEIEGPWAVCHQIVSFTECTDEVYVSGDDILWYSNNGGRSFRQVENPDYPSVIEPNALTGFEFSKYEKNEKYEKY